MVWIVLKTDIRSEPASIKQNSKEEDPDLEPVWVGHNKKKKHSEENPLSNEESEK